jgi:eukaryotic-like serine/threonine-protein kinase
VSTEERIAGRYILCEPLASGGMGSVHLGRLLGPAGFARTVAIKTPHKHLSDDPSAAAMFLDEARLVARIRHVNVVPTLEVLMEGRQIYLVMEYVPGVSLASVLRALKNRKEPMPVDITAAIVCGMLRGLHAAHEARTESGEPLDIIHRDVSPTNVVVGTDGIARVLDFGVAKARNRAGVTPGTTLKGKLAYMAPEYVTSQQVSRASDVFSAGVVLWECLAAERLFATNNEARTLLRVMELEVPSPSVVARGDGRAESEIARVEELDAVVLTALRREPEERYATAEEMANAIQQRVGLASPEEVSRLLKSTVAEELAQRAAMVQRIETPPPRGADSKTPPPLDDVSTTHAMGPTRIGLASRLPVRIAAASVALAIVVALAFAVGLPGGSSARSSTAPPAPVTAEHAPVDTPAPPASPPIPAPSLDHVADPVVPASSATSVRAQTSRPAARTPAPAANCDPPYTWENGMKRFRPECFRGTPR